MRLRVPGSIGLAVAANLAFMSLAYGQRALTVHPKDEQTISEDELYTGNKKNLIYFINGFSCIEGDNYVGQSPAPHYILNTLGKSGNWDVIVDSFKKVDCSKTMSEDAANTVYYRLFDLKKRGYKHIILAGQSLGAWASVIAAKHEDLQADALLLMVPARWGSREIKGRYNPNFFRNKTDFMYLLKVVRLPTALVLFDKDNFDPGGRGEEANAILEGNNVPHLIIDSPKGFSGHGAGWLPVFDYEFGACIEDFLKQPRNKSCETIPLSNNDFRSIVSAKQMPEDVLKTVSNDVFRSSLRKKFIVYLANGGSQENEFLSETKMNSYSSAKGNQVLPIMFDDGLYCAEEGEKKYCRYFTQWSKNQFLMFDKDTGKTTSWWIEEEKR